MKARSIPPSLLAMVLGIAALAVSGCNKSEDEPGDGRAQQYTCPMKEHSDVVQDKPGSCPKCGMKLVEKK